MDVCCGYGHCAFVVDADGAAEAGQAKLKELPVVSYAVNTSISSSNSSSSKKGTASKKRPEPAANDSKAKKTRK